ncbi:3-oxoacyl-reductase [Whalleya microplaca]|nr:3-oxoacyl-reductase [Whalleya microplaca]
MIRSAGLRREYRKGSRIGRAVGQRLVSLDANIVVCAGLNLDVAKEIPRIIRHNIQRLRNLGYFNVSVHQVDNHGRIDVVDNSAGFGAANQTPICDMPFDDWRNLDEVHNEAVMSSIAEDRPPVRGVIVMLTSLAPEGAFLGVGNYTAAKHAPVKGMVQTAAIESAAWGIRVNPVAPSYVLGPMMEQFLEASSEVKKAMLGDLPMGWLVRHGEVADAVALIASPASSYVHGHIFVVDGDATLTLSHTPFPDTRKLCATEDIESRQYCK